MEKEIKLTIIYTKIAIGLNIFAGLLLVFLGIMAYVQDRFSLLMGIVFPILFILNIGWAIRNIVWLKDFNKLIQK